VKLQYAILEQPELLLHPLLPGEISGRQVVEELVVVEAQ
jgi:hypothetical protein